MRMRHWALKGVLLALVLALIPALKMSADAAGPQSPACGNYKVVRNEVIAGVKVDRGFGLKQYLIQAQLTST